MEIAKVSAKGQLTIPAGLRKKLGLKRGSRVTIIQKENGFRVKLLNKKYFEEMVGVLGKKGELLRGLLRERKLDRIREDRRFG